MRVRGGVAGEAGEGLAGQGEGEEAPAGESREEIEYQSSACELSPVASMLAGALRQY